MRKEKDDRVYTLPGVAQWIECWLVKQRVAGSIPSLGHMPGLWTRSPVGGARETTTHVDVSLPVFLPPFSCLKINNKIYVKRKG